MSETNVINFTPAKRSALRRAYNSAVKSQLEYLDTRFGREVR